MHQRIKFILGYTALGVLLAITFYAVQPYLTTLTRPSVAIRVAPPQQPQPGHTAAGHADTVERSAASVVNIYTAKRVVRQPHPLFDVPRLSDPRQYRERLQTSLGSGVLVSADGYLLTNHHVIADADQIQVALISGESFPAQLIGSDPESDLAVLRIPAQGLTPAVFADAEQARVGDVVLAIGNPFGVGQTVTQGIISALGRSDLGINTFENFIQTDASINPGNSGGALVNTRGELIGINTAIFSRSGGSQGIGFAIPADLAQTVFISLVQHGRVIRGWLGIEGIDLTPDIAARLNVDATHGVLATAVLRNGPAALAGLRRGDIITHVNDRPTPNMRTALTYISRLQPTQPLRIAGLRNGQSRTWQAIAGERPRQQR